MKKLTTILSLLVLMAFISYLGWRSVEHEVLLRENNETLLVKSRINNIKLSIESLLNQRISYLNSLALQIDNNYAKAEYLLGTEADIKNIFIINKNRILFLSDFDDSQWHKLVESIALDNSVLLHQQDHTEQFQPSSGWYQIYNHLIYWTIQSDNIIGFELSNIKFSFDTINLLDKQVFANNFRLSDGDKQIYSNGEKFDNEISIVLD
ncbi:hypothetical protein, partial [Gilliamella apis]|uniref:hypothetical protein n=1 Tax=Gilliamella apis TaxID=1970738 RepID=UPI000B731DFB